MCHPPTSFALDVGCLEDLIKKVEHVTAKPIVEKGEGVGEGFLWEGIWYVLLLSERSYVDIVSLGYENSRLIFVSATVVWGGENRNNRREFFGAVPLMELVSSLLALVSPYDCFESLFLEQIVHWPLAVDHRYLPFFIVLKVDVMGSVALGIGP